MSLINELGQGYFNDMCTAALFMHEGQVCRIERAGGGAVTVTRYNDENENEDRVDTVPSEFFTGWKVFEYPVLGYRRFGPNLVGHVTRQQSTRRGLRLEAMHVQLTPCSNLLHQLGLVSAPSNRRKMMAAMRPQFDVYERDLPRLLEGDISALVLSDNFLIEPNVAGAKATGYNIYLRQHIVGTMDDQGAIRWEDENMSKLIDKYKVNTDG